MKDQECDLKTVRQDAKKLQVATEVKIKELSNLLSNPEEKDETTKFEVLEDEENFEVMECDIEKQRA